MILGGLVDGTGISWAEASAMTAAEAVFAWNCIMAFRKATTEKS